MKNRVNYNYVKNYVKKGVKSSVKNRVKRRAVTRRLTLPFTRFFTIHFTLFFTFLSLPNAPLRAQQQEPLRVPTSILERYVGEYDQNGTTVRISRNGDTLFREGPGQRVVLQPISETLFKMGPIFTTEFVIDQAGGVTQVVSSALIEYRFPRRGSSSSSRVLPIARVPVPKSVLERYVGTYEYLPGQMDRSDLRVVLLLRGDTLIRVIGSNETILVPTSATTFRVDRTALVTEFVVDDAGTTMVMGRGFQQLLARLTSR